MGNMKHRRVLSTDTLYNVRDLGGYKTVDGRYIKWDMLFRAGDLHNPSKKDIAVLENKQIKTIVDFRGVNEKNRDPDTPLATVSAVYDLAIEPGNIMDLAQTPADGNWEPHVEELYRLLVRGAHEQYRHFFHLISQPENTPLLFHCSAGKDRTGFAAALLLSALGVERKTVYGDYMLTAACLKDKYLALIRAKPHLTALMTVKRRYLDTAFAVLDTEYGGIDRYITHTLGIQTDLLQKLYTSPTA
jgi:protein-tyrosine phosphatase